jgi:hypothetical protein
MFRNAFISLKPTAAALAGVAVRAASTKTTTIKG